VKGRGVLEVDSLAVAESGGFGGDFGRSFNGEAVFFEIGFEGSGAGERRVGEGTFYREGGAGAGDSATEGDVAAVRADVGVGLVAAVGSASSNVVLEGDVWGGG